MKFLVLSFISIFFIASNYAQDERFFKTNMLKKEKGRDLEQQKINVPSMIVKGSSYYLDIDNDGFKERIVFGNKDGIDHLEIYNANSAKVFDSVFETKGPKSRFFKLELRKISSITNILIVYYFEGVTNYIELINKGYLYFVTIDRKDFSSLSMTKGPVFWIENRQASDFYYQRKFSVDIYDFNKDGIKEVRTRFHKLSSVAIYKGNGQWISF